MLNSTQHEIFAYKSLNTYTFLKLFFVLNSAQHEIFAYKS